MPWLVTRCLSLELTLNIHMQCQQEASCCLRPHVLTTAVEVCSHHSVCSASKRLPAACFRPSVLTTAVEVCAHQYVRSASKSLPAASARLY